MEKIKRKKMPLEQRAKVFLPFAALKGYNELVKEKEIVKEDKKILSEDELEYLSFQINKIQKGQIIKIKYYNDGGYVILEGMVSKIDEIYRKIYIVKQEINLDDISNIYLDENEF